MLFAISAVLALAVLAGLGAFAIWWSDPSNEARRLLSGATEKRLGELVEGERARVRGIARRGAEIKTSPLTQRRCIGFRFVIERWEDGLWESEGVWEDCAPFEFLADGAVARVEGPVLIGIHVDARGGDDDELTAGVRRAIAQLTKSDGYSRFRFREAILEDGDAIWVLGRVSLSVDPRGARSSTRSQPLLPVIRGTVHDPTVLADDEDQSGARSG